MIRCQSTNEIDLDAKATAAPDEPAPAKAGAARSGRWDRLIDAWQERDLSAAARAGLLPPAFGCEATVTRIAEILESGRSLIVTGDSGVGKTAAIYEFVRRIACGARPSTVGGRSVLQIALRRSPPAGPDKSPLRLEKLAAALKNASRPLVPYFRNFDALADFGLIDGMRALVHRHVGPVLAEGSAAKIEALFNENPDLADHFVLLRLHEPDRAAARRILRAWGDARAQKNGPPISDDAIDEALDLTYRFRTTSRLPRAALDLLDQVTAVGDARGVVGARDVIGRFCEKERIPARLVDPSTRLHPAAVERWFAERILGQPQGVAAACRLVNRIKSGLCDERRPFGAFLFAGPTGVGKTQLAQALAEFLAERDGELLRFDMAAYQRPCHTGSLFGESYEDTPAAKRGELTMRLAVRSFAVVLLDEFEKADPPIRARFLQLLDEGTFVNGAGETVSCRSMILIVTTNAGSKVCRNPAFGFAGERDREALSRAMHESLREVFALEFLNRFDEVVLFHPLGPDDIREIARRELRRLERRSGLARRGLSLAIDESVVEWIAERGYDRDCGARFLRRILERHVTAAIAGCLLSDQPPRGTRLRVSLAKDGVVAGREGCGPSDRVQF